MGFLFIPFYNVYWIYIAFYKLGTHYDVFDDQNSFKTSSMGWVFCVLIWCWAGGLLLAIFFLLISPVFSSFLYLLAMLSFLTSIVFLILLMIRINGHVVDRIPRDR